MANEKNLKPQNKRTKSEQREIARKGGIASGEARRKRKTLREELLALLETNDYNERISLAMIKEAQLGNTKAFNTIRDASSEDMTEPLTALENIILRIKSLETTVNSQI